MEGLTISSRTLIEKERPLFNTKDEMLEPMLCETMAMTMDPLIPVVFKVYAAEMLKDIEREIAIRN
jgi:hypothetical protein